MSVPAEQVDHLVQLRIGNPELNERTRDDAELAMHVAFASKRAHEAALEYEANGDRINALNNYAEAMKVGEFIARIYDDKSKADFLAGWK